MAYLLHQCNVKRIAGFPLSIVCISHRDNNKNLSRCAIQQSLIVGPYSLYAQTSHVEHFSLTSKYLGEFQRIHSSVNSRPGKSEIPGLSGKVFTQITNLASKSDSAPRLKSLNRVSVFPSHAAACDERGQWRESVAPVNNTRRCALMDTH